jgi:hypothetical protein
MAFNGQHLSGIVVLVESKANRAEFEVDSNSNLEYVTDPFRSHWPVRKGESSQFFGKMLKIKEKYTKKTGES